MRTKRGTWRIGPAPGARRAVALSCLSAVPLLVLAGCLQIETTIALQPDGSAVITERVQFSKKLLDLAASGGPDAAVAPLLERGAVLERMKHMGEGVELVRHEVRDAAGGARESTAVFKIPDVREFRYASPFLAWLDYPQNNRIKCDMFPVFESTWYGRRAGQMAVTFTSTARQRAEPEPKEGEARPPGPTPAQLQMLRELQPLAADMLSGIKVKVTFESYAPLRFRQYYRYRDMRARTHRFDLIDFSDADLDQYSMGFLENEEVMLELLAGKFSGGNLLETVKEHGTNMTVPVYHPRNIPEIYFNPSRELFDRYFQGKMLNFGERQGGEKPAVFDEIGHRGDGRDDAPEPSLPPPPPPRVESPTTQPDAARPPARGGRAPRQPRQPRRTPPPTTAPDSEPSP